MPLKHPKTPYQYHTSLKQIVQILYESEREMTRIESQKTLKMSNKAHFLTEYLRPALKAGLIEMTIPDKPQSSKQQYRLTELGRSLAQGLK